MLIPMPDTREAWLALRQKYVGASEVAALLGCQAAYALDHFALYHVKRGVPAPYVGGERIEWGKRMEEVVALAVAEENGCKVSRGRYATADDCPGMGASLDFEIEADPLGEFEGPGVLETKNVDWLVHRRAWTDGEPPIYTILQLQHQLACTGWKWGMVAAIVGGNHLETYRYAARPTLMADIKARVARFWDDIANDREPDISDSESCGAVLRSLYADPIDDSLDLSQSNEFPEAAAEFLAAAAKKKEATADYETARNRLERLMTGHKRAWGGGYSVSMSVTPEKPDRPAREGEIIRGRAETRRFTAKIQGMAA